MLLCSNNVLVDRRRVQKPFGIYGVHPGYSDSVRVVKGSKRICVCDLSEHLHQLPRLYIILLSVLSVHQVRWGRWKKIFFISSAYFNHILEETSRTCNGGERSLLPTLNANAYIFILMAILSTEKVTKHLPLDLLLLFFSNLHVDWRSAVFGARLVVFGLPQRSKPSSGNRPDRYALLQFRW